MQPHSDCTPAAADADAARATPRWAWALRVTLGMLAMAQAAWFVVASMRPPPGTGLFDLPPIGLGLAVLPIGAAWLLSLLLLPAKSKGDAVLLATSLSICGLFVLGMWRCHFATF